MRGSPLPLLSIDALVKAGVFGLAGDAHGTKPGKWQILIAGMAYIVEFDGDMYLRVENFEGVHQLLVERVSLDRGYRKYWHCPVCSKFCSDLVLIDDGKCRDCYRTSVSRYTRRHREALLFEAESEWRSRRVRMNQLVDGIHPAAEAPEQIDLPESSAPRALTNIPRSTQTAIALNRGEGMNQWEIFDRFAGFSLDEVMNLPTADGYSRPDKTGLIGDVPELSINAIYRHFNNEEEGLSALCLKWGATWDSPKTGLFYDLRFGRPIVVVAQDPYDPWNTNWQRLPILAHPTGRLRWLCPVLETPFDTLFKRGDLFASRKAQRMVSPSQRVAGRKGKVHGGSDNSVWDT